jgi:ABC-type lipoprotein export system ATPase subunit
MHIADVKPSFDHKVVRPRLSKGSLRHLEDTLENVQVKVPQCLLILGTVGAGKTTFLHYTRNVSAAKIVDQKIIWIYVDFKLATSSSSIRQFLYSQLLQYIESEKQFKPQLCT